ncbi:MAG: 2,3-bisphosphoglycerate-independent phosphoglycerate mutase [Blastopirellula sp.]|jgi:2,3-bisphosphoglycerate-independent phosphoglycerate mutase|nr:2,3-bisphosphoglycerate-independent phosphoglycerate mutase [Blastopirellula sp.]
MDSVDIHELTRELHKQNDSKLVMVVADGLGGLPLTPNGKTELETARTPNLDALASRNVQGLSIPVFPGISPGSGPGHLGLFGYDPLKYRIGRGALEATGIQFALEEGDVAARGNFCTLDSSGLISDRRAGRIASEESAPIAERLNAVRIPGVEVFVRPVKEHRFVVVFRGAGLAGDVDDTDPQATGKAPLAPRARNVASGRTAEVAAEFVRQARELLKSEAKANGLTLRGFAARPALPSFQEVYGLRAAAIAVYPMYKGLAQLVGMEIVGQAKTLQEQVAVMREQWSKYDFFFLHFKYTDSTGEDGNFAEKVRQIEALDAAIPQLMALSPTVLIVTGDHSTPSFLKSHSWHPVPTLLVSDCCRPDGCQEFSESAALRGGLGQFPAKYLMPLALSNAGRMEKYGA